MRQTRGGIGTTSQRCVVDIGPLLGTDDFPPNTLKLVYTPVPARRYRKREDVCTNPPCCQIEKGTAMLTRQLVRPTPPTDLATHMHTGSQLRPICPIAETRKRPIEHAPTCTESKSVCEDPQEPLKYNVHVLGNDNQVHKIPLGFPCPSFVEKHPFHQFPNARILNTMEVETLKRNDAKITVHPGAMAMPKSSQDITSAPVEQGITPEADTESKEPSKATSQSQSSDNEGSDEEEENAAQEEENEGYDVL